MKSGYLSWLLAVAMLGGCAAKTNSDYMRSPSLDYIKEYPRTPDGQIIGADRRDPSEKLQEGVQVGSEGVDLAPGWKRTDDGIDYDPIERVGGQGGFEERREPRVSEPEPAPPPQ